MDIYIAGPDVFLPNAIERGQQYVQLCQQYGYNGLFPLDNLIDTAHPAADRHIFDANRAMIQRADVVIANLNHFRGPEPDSGTVWEIAYAHGLGKRTIGYVHHTYTTVEKVHHYYPIHRRHGHWWCPQGMVIENFNNPLNLMVQYGLDHLVIGGFEDALQHLQETLTT